MSSKTKAQLAAENLALHARLTQLEDELAKRRPGKSPPPDRDCGRTQAGGRGAHGLGTPLSPSLRDRQGRHPHPGCGHGQITDANPFLESMLGYAHAELLGRTLWEIGPFRDSWPAGNFRAAGPGVHPLRRPPTGDQGGRAGRWSSSATSTWSTAPGSSSATSGTSPRAR